MKNVAVIYWSGTGNTEAMANLVLEGAQGAGAEAALYTPDQVDEALVERCSAVAMGCPAMGAEQLEEGEFEPMYQSIRGKLAGKPVGLFGSYGWGDGEWIRTWADDCTEAGANLVAEPVMANGAAEGEDADACTALGAALANA